MKRLTLIIVIVLALPVMTIAAIRYVPGEYPSIQAGINACQGYDTVLVAPGIYREHIIVRGNILIKSEAGPEHTIIEKRFDGIELANMSWSVSTLEGFTLRNSTASAIKFRQGAPKIRNCVIESNASSPDEPQGGGINSIDAGPWITKCIIRNNSATTRGDEAGGGICLIGSGGSYGNPFIDSCIFYGNVSQKGGGLALVGSWSSVQLTRSIFYSNEAPLGSAIAIDDTSGGGLFWNTIIGNETSQTNALIYIQSPLVVNSYANIIAYSRGYGIFAITSEWVSSNYDCLFANALGDIYGIIPMPGDIFEDPLFLNVQANDFRLTANSPCIDAISQEGEPDSTLSDIGALYFDQRYRLQDFYQIAPAGNAVLNVRSVSFSWHASVDIDSGYPIYYDLFLDTDLSFASPDTSGTSPDTVFTFPDSLERSRLYYWRVLAQNYRAGPVYSVETRSFYIDGYPTMPNPLAPDDGGVVDTGSYLVWDAAFDPDSFDIITYALEVDNDLDFSSPLISIAGITDSGLVAEEAVAVRLGDLPGADSLTESTLYYWRVRSDDSFDLHSDFTPCCRSFYFRSGGGGTPPLPFPLYGPSDGSTLVLANSRFEWGAADDPDPNPEITYIAQYSPDSFFAVNVWTIGGLTDTTVNVHTDSLSLLGQSVYWRVIALDEDSLFRIGGIDEDKRFFAIIPPGDANTNGVTNGIDVTYLVAYLKGLGPAPNPLLAGDANGSCQTNGIDVTYLVNYLKGIGPAPVRPDCGLVLSSGNSPERSQ